MRDHCRKEKVDDQVPRRRAHGEIRSTHPNTKLKRSGTRDVDELSNVDHIDTTASSSHFEAQLHIFEDNEAVLKVIIRRKVLR